MHVTRSKHRGEDGHLNEPLVLIAIAAIVLIGFLLGFAKARDHGCGVVACIGAGILGGLVPLAILGGVSLSFVGLALWSEARKRRREMEKEEQG